MTKISKLNLKKIIIASGLVLTGTMTMLTSCQTKQTKQTAYEKMGQEDNEIKNLLDNHYNDEICFLEDGTQITYQELIESIAKEKFSNNKSTTINKLLLPLTRTIIEAQLNNEQSLSNLTIKEEFTPAGYIYRLYQNDKPILIDSEDIDTLTSFSEFLSIIYQTNGNKNLYNDMYEEENWPNYITKEQLTRVINILSQIKNLNITEIKEINKQNESYYYLNYKASNKSKILDRKNN